MLRLYGVILSKVVTKISKTIQMLTREEGSRLQNVLSSFGVWDKLSIASPVSCGIRFDMSSARCYPAVLYWV